MIYKPFLSTENNICYWQKLNSGKWQSNCNKQWRIDGETPFGADMYYCPHCGRRIVIPLANQNGNTCAEKWECPQIG